MGYYYLMLTGPYLPMCILTPFIFKRFPRKLLYIICFIISGVGLGLMGPTQLLKLPDNLTILCIGIFITGSVQSLTFVMCLPEAIDLVSIHFKIVEGYDEELDGIMNDALANLYNIFYSGSGLVSPLIGGLLYEYKDYQTTMDISMLFMFALAAIYFVFNCGPKVFGNFNKEKEEL